MTVPGSKVTLAIPADSLRSLPSGAGYHGRSGQASLSVKGSKTDDGAPAIIVEASCDSLQLQCEHYERVISTMEAVYAEKYGELLQQIEAYERASEVVEPRSNGVLTAIKWLAIGIFAGIFLKGIKN